MAFEITVTPDSSSTLNSANVPDLLAAARQKSGPLTDTALKGLKPRAKAYKVTDGGGMYVVITPAGSKSFRFDYRADRKRLTLTIGQYEPATANRNDAELQGLDYGAVLSLKDARALRDRASRQVAAGDNPSKAKVTKRTTVAGEGTFGVWAAEYIKFKSDPKSGEEQWAEATLGLKRSIYQRLLEGPLSKRRMGEIKRGELADLFDRIKANNGPGPAVHAREFVLVTYRYAMTKDETITVNPVEAIPRRNIATFAARERNLNRHEIKIFFDALQRTQSSPTLRLALRFVLLTMVRKGEFIGATWKEINWERAMWTIPAARMKNGKEHFVPLSNQSLDILTTLQTCFPSSVYLHPGRYESDIPISDPALNRVIDITVRQINKEARKGGDTFETFSVHDLRRTASTRLNDALFPEPLIEACLAHVKKDQVAAAYNHAKHTGPRRALMQGWADMVDCWMRGESARDVIVMTKAKIDEAAHGDSEADL